MHSYPRDLARFVRERWPPIVKGGVACVPLPSEAELERLLSVAYQASLLRDEERPVIFRLILGEPERFPNDAGPPFGHHRLIFDRPRPLTEHELRRLALAVKYHRSLIGVRPAPGGGFEIWGMLHSGPRWLQTAQGGRTPPPEPTPGRMLVVRAVGPGRLAVGRGYETIAELRGGQLSEPSLDVFQSQ